MARRHGKNDATLTIGDMAEFQARLASLDFRGALAVYETALRGCRILDGRTPPEPADIQRLVAAWRVLRMKNRREAKLPR
jgi:hypothetical protein